MLLNLTLKCGTGTCLNRTLAKLAPLSLPADDQPAPDSAEDRRGRPADAAIRLGAPPERVLAQSRAAGAGRDPAGSLRAGGSRRAARTQGRQRRPGRPACRLSPKGRIRRGPIRAATRAGRPRLRPERDRIRQSFRRRRFARFAIGNRPPAGGTFELIGSLPKADIRSFLPVP